MPRLGWQGWLVEFGLGDRLPHATTIGLASIAYRQGEHCIGSVGAGLDRTLRYVGASPGAVPVWLGFTSRDCTRLVRSYGLKLEFITQHCPQQSGMVERVIRTLKEQRMHRHRFESLVHELLCVIGDWIGFYNRVRPHQALKMMIPDAAYAFTLPG